MTKITQTVSERIFQLLRGGQDMTRQDIAEKLSLSMPTTLQHVTRLLEAGILEECGAAQSSGGRKAKMLRLSREAGRMVGVQIGVRGVDFVVTDLLEGIRQAGSVPLAFCDTPDWYHRFQEAMLGFLRENQVESSHVLGVGVSFPGIVDRQRDMVTRSHILGVSHMGLDRFRKAIPFPSVFANDANCACFAERKTARNDYVYLSLNESVGGAVMLNGQLWRGDAFQAGEIGHMLLVPGGRQCYCGKKGCADAYLSPQALEQDGWDVYLDHLAILVTNLRMLLSVDLVAGGQVGAQIGPHMEHLRAKAAEYDRFARDIDYIFPCVQREYACALGAAGFGAEAFGTRLLPGTGEEPV